MELKPWMFCAMEEYGQIDTRQGRINRIARYLGEHTSGDIDAATFKHACSACGIDPHSFCQSDIDAIQKKLNEL